MRKIYIICALNLVACQESQFQQQTVSEASTAELVAPPVNQDLIIDSVSSEPVMVGGAFLTCQSPSVQDDHVSYHAYCRLEKDSDKVEIMSAFQALFQVKLLSEQLEPLSHEDLDSLSAWHWLVSIPKSLEFASIQLRLSDNYQQNYFYEFAITQEFFTIAEDEEELDSEELLPTVFNYKLGSAEQEFFVVGNAIMNQSANMDCSAEIISKVQAQAATIVSEKSFVLEIPEGGARLTIEIPKICGVHSLSGELDFNRVNIRYPDGSLESLLLPALASKFVVMADRFVGSGSLTITIQSRRTANNIGELDTFVFWHPLLTSNHAIVELP